ncbi:sodium/potassium/calcium exchanger Nckx30C isoform X3 [Bactrocera oleae]|uniref:sodium/potassium/calcium exchanger Nckx30C isoform X3 n=1 Tax=Bactrocera oleae TaxID=104688 RepID=UPI00387E7F0F
MPLAVVSMLQQQKCLETLDEQQQKNQATAAAEVGSTQRQYAETRLTNALNAAGKEEKRTAWQHVTATEQQLLQQQQVSSEESLRETSDLHNVRITDKCMLNAAARQQSNVASNITHTYTDVATLVEHTEANVALGKVLNKSKHKRIAQTTTTTTLHVANHIGDKLLSNMLPLARLKTKRARHHNVAAVQSAEKRAKIANAKAKATKLNTTINQSTQSAEMCEMAAPTGEPSVKQQRQHQYHNSEKTIDFNSRRRRGRLRADNVDAVRLHNGAFGSGVTATVCRALMWLARYLEKVAHNRANAGYDQSDPLLYLLSVLLSLIVVNVNRVASLVNEYKCEVNSNELANTNNKTTNTNANTTNTPNTNSAKNDKNHKIITNQTIELVSEPMAADSVAELLQLPENSDDDDVEEKDKTSVDALEFESEFALVAKAKNNKKTNAQNTVTALDRNALVLTERADLMTAGSATKRGKSNCAANAHASATTTTTGGTSKTFVAMQMQLLFYAFILCTSILLPSGNNFVAAAKPKSATQLQQQKLLQQQQQQQQYEHQHGHQAHQPAAGPNGGFGTLGGYAGPGIPVSSGGTAGADLTPPTYQVVSSRASNEQAEFIFPADQSDEQVFDQENLNVVELDDDDDDEEREKAYGMNGNETAPVNVTKAPLFPKDLFTKEQLENGAVICHIIGVIYMFVALAIVCDEFFVPSLDVIIEKLDITDDVAGATFMAAGGSAPELFTSVIGVFISFDDVGIGTIVGSAVFNILFVIGMCALFSKTILALTWWPLFRDCSFYSISLLVLIYFFRDNFIYWWEALILFSIYIAYVAFMKWNVQVERFVKRLVTKNKGNAANSSETSMATQPGGSVTSRAASETRSGPPGSSSGAGATGNSSGGTAGSTHTGAKFRHGLLQLMIHTIDPLHDDDVPGKVDEKATQLHAIASLKVLLDATKPQRGGATTSAANHVKINLKETTLADRPNGNIDTTLDSPSIQSQSGRRPSWIDQRVKIQTRKFSIKANEIEDEPEPLSMAWPDTARKRLTYIMVAPLLIPMWLTLPDTRTPRGKKYYPVTFIGSILWIAAFSYLMVWWANVAGDTARIPPEVMGLTFLAAGTSIPDLITSVIVARKGFGDMAVSSSVGSNIFDVTVGLPIPWLIYGIIYDAPVEVNSVGMVCSITILFMMLLFVVMSIACFRWKMNRGLGFTMFLLYFVFVAVSLMFEYDTLQCPV